MSQIYEVILHWKQCENSISSSVLKADMKSYIQLDTTAIFFLANRELQNEKFLPIAGLELTTPDSQV